jgi:predicted DNA-binding transcriptional regulator YafY
MMKSAPLGIGSKCPNHERRSRMRYAVMRRQLELLLLLQSEPDGVSVSEIIERFGVEDGTIYRDLKMFQAVGIKLTNERRGKRNFWRADQFRGENALKRQWRLVRELGTHRNGLSVAELAVNLEVSEWTVRRDLQVLLEAGFPLIDEPGEGRAAYWRLLCV